MRLTTRVTRGGDTGVHTDIVTMTSVTDHALVSLSWTSRFGDAICQVSKRPFSASWGCIFEHHQSSKLCRFAVHEMPGMSYNWRTPVMQISL